MTRLPWPSRGEPEGGFTLIEVLIALGVMFSALVVLAYTMMGGLSAVGFSRQRTEATALANQALEQIRALPSSQLFLNSSDLATDPANLVSCGSNTCFNGRQVPTANFGTNPPTTPLTPHISAPITAVPGNTQYTITTYLTYDYPLDPTYHTLIATVQVTWSSALKGGVANKVQVESKIYNDQFDEAPPGTHNFLANAAGGTQGSISVAATFLGNSVANVLFPIPSTSAGMGGSSFPNSTNVGTGTSALGVITPVNASVAQSLVSAAAVNVLSTNAVSEAESSAAGGSYNTSPLGTSTPTIASGGASSLVGLSGSVGATAAVGAKATVQSDAASTAGGQAGIAGGTSPLPATSLGLGFGQAVATQTGVVSANLSLLLGALNIGLVTLTPTGNGSPDIATVSQTGSPAAPQSQVFNASATQQLATIGLLNLPVVGQAITLTGFDQEAYACATPPPATCTAHAPAATVNTGSLTVLGQTYPLSQLIDPLSGVLNTVNNALDAINVNVLGTGITVSGGIALGTAASSSAGSATVPSPLIINLAVHIALVGLSALTLNVAVNLGTVTASASYS